MTTEHPDIVLARRARNGDDGAWSEIYRTTRQRLFGLLEYQTGSRDEALDILQDTYLVAVRSIDRYRATGSLESWLTGIAIRRACDWKRRLLPKLKRSDPLHEIPPAKEKVRHPHDEEGHLLRRALSRLSDRQRSAVLLHEWFGYTFAEIAEAMGVSEATARVHAFRGRETLREQLSTSSPPEPASGGIPAGVQELRR
jgi:RNA polymerase sigma-70 factor (ECF subfamily)